jgi:hypothetical protein
MAGSDAVFPANAAIGKQFCLRTPINTLLKHMAGD